MRLKPSTLLPLLAMGLIMGAGDPPSGDVVARRGDIVLTRPELAQSLARLDPAVRAQVVGSPQALANFARERVLNDAVIAEAHSQSWETKPEIARRIEEARNTVILQTYLASKVTPDPAFPSEAEVSKAYEANKGRLIAPKQYHLAQIVLLVPQGASATDDDDVRKHLLDLRNQVTKQKADFAEVANQLGDGAVSQPVRMPDGWHLIKMLGSKPAGQIPLIDAKPQLVQALRQARVQGRIKEYLDQMLQAGPIEVNEIAVTKTISETK
jgi:peptidylprolyl isomerase